MNNLNILHGVYLEIKYCQILFTLSGFYLLPFSCLKQALPSHAGHIFHIAGPFGHCAIVIMVENMSLASLRFSNIDILSERSNLPIYVHLKWNDPNWILPGIKIILFSKRYYSKKGYRSCDNVKKMFARNWKELNTWVRIGLETVLWSKYKM